MKKSVLTVFLLIWCACLAAGQNDELFRRALSERNERRWYEISERFVRHDEEAWDRMYSSWVWQQIESRIASPDIQRFSNELTDQTIRLTRGENRRQNLADSLASWRGEGQLSLQSLYQSWEAAADAVYEQLASALPESGQSQVASYFADYKNKVHKELETLLLAGERRFLASQLPTVDSENNDDITGKKKLEELFDGIASSSDSSLQSLKDSMENAVNSGLAQWNSYTIQTLSSKLDWDRLNALQSSASDEDWENALSEFTDTRNTWFSELYSVIQDGKAALEGRAASFLSGMEETLEQTRTAFEQNAQLLQNRMNAIFSQYTTVTGIKTQASENRQSLLAEKTRLENYRSELQASVNSYAASIANQDKTIKAKQDALKDDEKRLYIERNNMNDHNEYWMQRVVDRLEKEIADLKAEISRLQSERTNMVNQKNALEGLITQQNERISTYSQQADFWADAIARCNTRESEIRQSMAGIEYEMRNAGWPESADIQFYQLKSEVDALTQNAEIARKVYEYALDISSGNAVMEDVYDAYAEAEKELLEADAAYKASVSSLKELADKMSSESDMSQETYQTLSNEYSRMSAASKELYDRYSDAVMNFKVQDRKREYVMSQGSTPEDALKSLNEAEKALAEATEKYESAVSLARQNEEVQGKGQSADMVQASLYLNKVGEVLRSDSEDCYAKAMLAEQNINQHLSDRLFKESDSIALEFVQKMNNSILREFSLAYYWRSLQNSGFKTIDVAIYSDQNFQKLKSYGYAFSHPEDYTKAQAQAAYNSIVQDAEKLRLYNYFEKSVNNGSAQFDISFIGKDVSDLAHDYLWDISVEKEENYERNHSIYNFFTRKSKKMRSMRKAMADIDGNKERQELMDVVSYIKNELETKARYEAAGELALGENSRYTFDEFMAKCRECTGLVLENEAIVEKYFLQLDQDETKGFLSILSALSERIASDYDSSELSIGLLRGLDDYGSSSNRLVIMNLTGTELMDMYQTMADLSVEKTAMDLNSSYEELAGEASAWTALMQSLMDKSREKWDEAFAELKERRHRSSDCLVRSDELTPYLVPVADDNIEKDEGLMEEMLRHSTYLVALRMSASVDDMERQMFTHIEKANQTADKKVTDILEGKGYVRHGSIFRRKVIAGESLLGGIEYERQSIEGYRWFSAPAFNLGVNLSPSYIEGLDLVHLETLIDQAETAIDRYTRVVFGQSTSLDASSWSGFDQDMLAYVKQAESGFRSSAQYKDHSDIKGLFAMHIGYVPIMSSSNPEKVVKQGYGEYGRIFELFYKNEGRLGRGLAAIDVPFYMQTLWDEDSNNDGKRDNMLFALPSIRQGGEIVCNIFSSINPALGMMVTAFDSTTFAALDMVFAGKSLEDAAKDVNKRMAAAASNWGTSALAQAAQPAQSVATGERLLQSTAVSVGKGYADQVAVSAADGDIFDKAVKPDAKQGLGNLVRNWISSRLSGFLGDDRLAAEQIAGFAGTLTDAGYELATTGKAKFNVLNLSSFCDAHVGLLEMNLGGEGPIFEIGSGGYDISKGRVESAIKSAYILKEEDRIRHSSDFSRDNKITMRALFSEGKIQNQVGELYNLLLNDGVSVEYKDLKDSLAYTSSDNQGVRNIILNLIPSNAMTDQLKMAVVLAHEAYRNGKDDGVFQILETADAVVGHAKMAYDILSSGFSYPDIANLKNEVESIIGGNFKDLIVNAICNYVSGGDYWRIISEGKVAWDGHMNLYQENGNLLYSYQKMREVLQNGLESVSGVSQDRLNDIVWKNTLLEMVGKKADGTYVSKAAEALLSDGYMSYDEAMDSLAGTAGKSFAVPDVFQHYSARIVANDTTLLEKIFTSPEMIDNWTDRNQPVQYLNGVKATLLPDSKSVFHISPEDKATYKWVLDDGRELVIGERKDGTKYVQTDDHYLGTYNMANPDNPVEHAVKDVFPYAFLGNTPDDSSIANFLFSL